jgi:hypothetical protein
MVSDRTEIYAERDGGPTEKWNCNDECDTGLATTECAPHGQAAELVFSGVVVRH